MTLKLSEDIRPVTDLKSHGAEIVRDVTNGRTVVLSRHGRAVAVMLAVAEYEGLVAAAAQPAMQRAVDEAEREIAAGQGVPHAIVRERLLALTRTR